MNKKLFTIGHSTHTIEKFIQLLNQHDINCIVDVRSTPYSQYIPTFNKENISIELKSRNIQYIHMGNEFGARRDNGELYSEDGRLDFEKTVKDKAFQEGIKRIENGLEKGYRIAFMCAEKNPVDCHRCILVGKAFYDLGYDVDNILESGKVLTQKQVGILLLDKYFPKREQLSFLDKKPEERDAYRKRAEEIAYRKTETEVNE